MKKPKCTYGKGLVEDDALTDEDLKLILEWWKLWILHFQETGTFLSFDKVILSQVGKYARTVDAK